MPIAGLSENRRLPRLGKIRLGVKVPNSSGSGEHPKAVDYFVIPAELAADLAKVMGYQGKPEDFKPAEIPVMIPMDDEEYWCSQYYKRYSMTRGLVCKGDGRTARRMIDKDTGAIADRNTKEVVWKDGVPCKGRECPDYQGKLCQEVMNLQVLMPDVPGLGVWQIDTGSINSIKNVNSAAMMLRVMFGKVWGIPLLLTLEPQEVNNPEDGKKKTVRVLNLRIRGTVREINELVAGKSAMLLPAPEPDETEAPADTKHIEDLWPEDNPNGNAAKAAVTSPPAAQTAAPGPGPGPAPAPKATKETKGKDKPARDPKTITNITQLLLACFQDFGLQSNREVVKELGLSSTQDIADPADAYRQIVAARKA